jgi:hypothetical protein
MNQDKDLIRRVFARPDYSITRHGTNDAFYVQQGVMNQDANWTQRTCRAVVTA